jgi:acetolactate synthase-1/2/3 large subunit
MTASPSRTLGVYLAELLEAYGVDTIFGIPGVHTVEFYRGLPLTRIRHVTPRHEQGAGFMADGYARVSGKPGVCLLITGPGLTNAATAMAQAYADSIPMLVITAVNAVGRMGSGDGWLHELKDQRQLSQGLTAFSHTVYNKDDLDQALARAFAIFASARPRPVHIEIPTDIIRLSVSLDAPVHAAAMPLRPAPRAQSVAEAVKHLQAAKRPLILTGGGASDASAPLRLLAEKLDAPLVMTVNARGILPGDHPLAVPCNPSLAAIRSLMVEADLILAVGTEFGPTDYDWYETGVPKLSAKLIRVDIDPEQAMRGHRADCVIVADAKATTEALLAGFEKASTGSGAARAKTARARVMQDDVNDVYRASLAMLNETRDRLQDAVIIGDSAQPVYAASVAYAAKTPRSFFASATGFGTLGYALPAAIGAQLAAPHRPIVAVMGDGGLQFTLAEIASAVEAQTPIILIVWNNRGYGEIKSFMVSRQIEPIGVDIGTPDFIALAKAFGAAAETLVKADDLPRLLIEAAKRNVPTLIEIDETMYVRERG